MTELLSASLFLIAPLVAAAAPYLAERYRLAQRLPLERLPRLSRSGYAPLPEPFSPTPTPSAFAQPVRLSTRHAFSGAVMFTVQFATCYGFLELVETASLLVLSVALCAGILMGFAALALVREVLAAFKALRPARALSKLGVSSVHLDKDPAAFKNSILESVRAGHELEIVCSDGLDLLRALSHNARPALEAPHPDLRGARIHMLLLPPRSGTIDYETRGRSTAEVAIARLGRSPEDHWRLLHAALEVQERWVREYGLVIKVRFLETRPAFRVVRAGSRAWFQPWGSNEAWIETKPSDECGLNRALRGLIIEADAQAKSEVEYPLSAGPTKTTFIKKGVEVPGFSDASQLEVEDCTEQVA